jgi:hypothetical protein
VLAGDDFVTLPVAGLGVVPLLIEVAAGFESGELDPLEIIDRSSLEPVTVAGVWQHLKAPALPLADLAVLTAATGDAPRRQRADRAVGLPAVLCAHRAARHVALGAAGPVPRRARSRRRLRTSPSARRASSPTCSRRS